jgi:hypothetical protein
MKKMANPRYLRSLVALSLLVLVVLACRGGGSMSNDTDKANKLVDEGNAAVQEAKKFAADAEDKKNQIMQMDIRRLAEARVRAAEAVASYDKAAEKCKEAAQKYDEASRLQINDNFKQYLILKVREYNKRAEMVDTAKGTPQALIESTNRSSFVIRANSNNAKVDQLSKEADNIGAQAEKIQKDNPDLFKK